MRLCEPSGFEIITGLFGFDRPDCVSAIGSDRPNTVRVWLIRFPEEVWGQMFIGLAPTVTRTLRAAGIWYTSSSERDVMRRRPTHLSSMAQSETGTDA
jgi:hypothetical protein